MLNSRNSRVCDEDCNNTTLFFIWSAWQQTAPRLKQSLLRWVSVIVSNTRSRLALVQSLMSALSSVQWLVWSGSSFDDRLSLCKTLKGFHVRAITMNRALAYIASGDHRKWRHFTTSYSDFFSRLIFTWSVKAHHFKAALTRAETSAWHSYIS